jgi:hypothetical protein
MAISREGSPFIDIGQDTIDSGDFAIEGIPPSLSRFYLRQSSVRETVVSAIVPSQNDEVEVRQVESAARVSWRMISIFDDNLFLVQDLIAPVRPLDTPPKQEALEPEGRQSTESSNVPPPISVALEPAVSTLPEQAELAKRWWKISFARKQSTAEKPVSAVVAADNSTVILPSPPTEFEKTIYAQTRRCVYYLHVVWSMMSYSIRQSPPVPLHIPL